MKPLKKLFLILLLALFFFAGMGAAPKPGYQYVGSVKSKKLRFHRFTCKWAKKIKPDRAIYFKTRKEAVKKGFVPCSVCKP